MAADPGVFQRVFDSIPAPGDPSSDPADPNANQSQDPNAGAAADPNANQSQDPNAQADPNAQDPNAQDPNAQDPNDPSQLVDPNGASHLSPGVKHHVDPSASKSKAGHEKKRHASRTVEKDLGNKMPQLKKDADDAVDTLKEEAKKDADIAAEKLKEAGRLIKDLAIKVKDLGLAVAKDTEGCRLQAAAIAVAVVAASVSIAAIVFPAPADVTPGVAVAAPIQLAGVVGMFLSVAGLIAAIASYVKCKEDQVETLGKEAAQDRQNKELEEKLRKLQQQIDDIKNRKQDLQSSLNQIRKFVA